MGIALFSSSCTVNGVTASIAAAVEQEGEIKQTIIAEMAYEGEISTDTDRVITTTSVDPEIEASDGVVIFWEGGVARDVVQSVSGDDGNVIKLSSGGASHEGDTLPVDTTEVIIAKETVVNLLVPASTLEAIAVSTDKRAHISFRKAADALISNQEHIVTQPYSYISGLNQTDPIGAYDCESLRIATADITADRGVEVGILYDSVI